MDEEQQPVDVLTTSDPYYRTMKNRNARHPKWVSVYVTGECTAVYAETDVNQDELDSVEYESLDQFLRDYRMTRADVSRHYGVFLRSMFEDWLERAELGHDSGAADDEYLALEDCIDQDAAVSMFVRFVHKTFPQAEYPRLTEPLVHESARLAIARNQSNFVSLYLSAVDHTEGEPCKACHPGRRGRR